jgi:hypothetical protein
MIGATPLEAWLKANGITEKEAYAKCRKRKCDGAYKTLMVHPFTLPLLAYNVARALHIPAQDAAPMGKPLDAAAWKRKGGLEPLDKINFDPLWYERLNHKYADAETPVWLNVINMRTILGNRGINWQEWCREHRPLYQGCRSYSLNPAVRHDNIVKMAELLEVEPAVLLTNIPTIAEQQATYHPGYQKPITDGIPDSDQWTDYCLVNVPEVWRRYNEMSREQFTAVAMHYSELLGRHEKQEFRARNSLTGVLRNFEEGKKSQWHTIVRLATAFGCEPEDLAHRMTRGEWRQFYARQRASGNYQRREAEE